VLCLFSVLSRREGALQISIIIITDLVNRNVDKIDTQQFSARFLVPFVKNRPSGSQDNTTVSTATQAAPSSLYNDVMDKGGMCGESIKDVTSQALSVYHWYIKKIFKKPDSAPWCSNSKQKKYIRILQL